MDKKLWEHIWGVFDAWMTSYESHAPWPEWKIQKRIIQHLVNLTLIAYHIDWPAFWKDIEDKLEYTGSWETQKNIIAEAFDIKYCRRRHMMDKPRRAAVSFER